MTATTAEYVSDEPKGTLSVIADTIRFAMKLKDEFEKIEDPEARHEAVCRIITSH
jgi:hypothetical protein